jgi:hypothetical protein
MPVRPSYTTCPGDRLEVEVVQPDGGRALVVGKLDAVPESAGRRALRIVVSRKACCSESRRSICGSSCRDVGVPRTITIVLPSMSHSPEPAHQSP